MPEADVASTSLLETWIDESQRRVWFLFENRGRAIDLIAVYVDGSGDHNCRSTLLHTSFLKCAQQIARFGTARKFFGDEIMCHKHVARAVYEAGVITAISIFLDRDL